MSLVGPVDLFNGTTFVQAFLSLAKAQKFSQNPRRKITNPMFWPHDENNGPIISAGRKEGQKNVTEMVNGIRVARVEISAKWPGRLETDEVMAAALLDMGTSEVDWSQAGNMFQFADVFEDAAPSIMRPTFDHRTMVDTLDRLY